MNLFKEEPKTAEEELEELLNKNFEQEVIRDWPWYISVFLFFVPQQAKNISTIFGTHRAYYKKMLGKVYLARVSFLPPGHINCRCVVKPENVLPFMEN